MGALLGALEFGAVDFALYQQLGGVQLIGLGTVMLWELARADGLMRRERVRHPVAQTACPLHRPGNRLFLLGFSVGLANPLALVFFIAILPQFVAAGMLDGPGLVLCFVAVLASSLAGMLPFIAAAGFRLPGWLQARLSGAAGGGLILFGVLAAAQAV